MVFVRRFKTAIVPKEDLMHWLRSFWPCEWLGLLQESNASNPIGTRRRSGQTPEQAADRAQALVQLGELSAARQVLTSPGLAPGTPATLNELRNEERRPRHQYEDMPISPEVLEASPEPVSLKNKSLEIICRKLGGARPLDPPTSRANTCVSS